MLTQQENDLLTRVGLEFEPKPAARVIEIIDELLTASPDVVERMSDIRQA